MEWSRYFLPTGREVPAEATAPSHRLMIRAGLIRQLGAGVYTFLPLGLRVIRKVERIIRQEMEAAGAVELLMPAMQPIELWQESGRDVALGTTLIRLPDRPWRKGTVLGPTHEEVITDIIRSHVQSYRQLPLNLYQIQTKFRDEQRPRSGVLRTREFLMKDAYSFDADAEGLSRAYDRMYQAYCRIFHRCGLPCLPAQAESGAIGGDDSHEFMVPAEAGEDILVRCEGCGYAANLERAAAAPPEQTAPAAAPDEVRQVHTPGRRTIEEVCAFLGRPACRMIKTLIYRTPAGEVVVALVRGDHEVNPAKLARAVENGRRTQKETGGRGGSEARAHEQAEGRPAPGGVELADIDTIRAISDAEVGFAGPQGLADKGVRIIVDPAVAAMHDAAAGANRTDYHVTGLEPGRDFPLKEVADIRVAVEGDRCARCDARLRFVRCIEVGHVFKLGVRYASAMQANFADEQGLSHPILMGCYGIGVSRVVAAVIEANHDDKGIIWPVTVSPFQVLVVNLEGGDEKIAAGCRRIYDKLRGQGIDALYDDRALRPGPKFIDADLIGIPLRIAVGKRSFAESRAELKWRDSAAVELLPIDAVAEAAAVRIREAIARTEPSAG